MPRLQSWRGKHCLSQKPGVHNSLAYLQRRYATTEPCVQHNTWYYCPAEFLACSDSKDDEKSPWQLLQLEKSNSTNLNRPNCLFFMSHSVIERKCDDGYVMLCVLQCLFSVLILNSPAILCTFSIVTLHPLQFCPTHVYLFPGVSTSLIHPPAVFIPKSLFTFSPDLCMFHAIARIRQNRINLSELSVKMIYK